MTTGRIRLRDWRVYVDGYDLSGYTRSFGPLATVWEEGVDDALPLNVKGAMLGSANISMGALNGLFDNTATSGIHVVMKGAGIQRNVLLACGIQAAPVSNDPTFAGQFMQGNYYGDPSANPVTATIDFPNTSAIASNLGYGNPWGVLLLAKAAKTAANSATGLDQTASSAKGGWFMYQVLAGDGTAAVKVQHAGANSDGSFADLLSSGSIDCATPKSGVVALANTVTVNRYVRWQIALGTATTVTFALSFHRNLL